MEAHARTSSLTPSLFCPFQDTYAIYALARVVSTYTYHIAPPRRGCMARRVRVSISHAGKEMSGPPYLSLNVKSVKCRLLRVGHQVRIEHARLVPGTPEGRFWLKSRDHSCHCFLKQFYNVTTCVDRMVKDRARFFNSISPRGAMSVIADSSFCFGSRKNSVSVCVSSQSVYLLFSLWHALTALFSARR